MIDLSSHIEFLLLRHDCVVVPGLGAFLVHESSARYDEETGMFYPPSSSLGFNPAVTHNDGLLVESVARREKIGLEAAMQNVQAEVSAFRHQLSMSGELPVGSLGVMSVGSEPDALLFEPAQDSSVSVRYFGLSPVAVRPLVEEVHEIHAGLESDEEEKAQPLLLTLPFKIAASIISLLVVCGILYSTTNLVENGTQNYASLDSGLSGRVEVAGLRPVSDVEDNLSREIVLNIARPLEENSEVSPAEPLREPAAAVPGRYILVVASFQTLRGAEKHVAYLGANDLSILEMDGNFRVYHSSFATQGEAYAQAEKIKEKYPTVWVCKR